MTLVGQGRCADCGRGIPLLNGKPRCSACALKGLNWPPIPLLGEERAEILLAIDDLLCENGYSAPKATALAARVRDALIREQAGASPCLACGQPGRVVDPPSGAACCDACHEEIQRQLRAGTFRGVVEFAESKKSEQAGGRAAGVTIEGVLREELDREQALPHDGSDAWDLAHDCTVKAVGESHITTWVGKSPHPLKAGDRVLVYRKRSAR